MIMGFIDERRAQGYAVELGEERSDGSKNKTPIACPRASTKTPHLTCVAVTVTKCGSRDPEGRGTSSGSHCSRGKGIFDYES